MSRYISKIFHIKEIAFIIFKIDCESKERQRCMSPNKGWVTKMPIALKGHSFWTELYQIYCSTK